MQYSIGKFSGITNLSIHTLRYYEKEQLIMAERDSAGRRYYTEKDIGWIQFIKRLKETGMSIKEIKEFALLQYQGDSTLLQRLHILERHLLFALEEKEKWESNLMKLEAEIKIYRDRIAKMQNPFDAF